jgi:hypothetical protein
MKPNCSFCSYDLTGLRVDGSCPECGNPIWVDANARAAELAPVYARVQTSFYASMMGLILSFGCGPFGIVLSIWAIVQSAHAVHDRRKLIGNPSSRNMPFVSLTIAILAALISVASTASWLIIF